MKTKLLATTPQGGKLIERAGRVCYRSHDRMNDETSPRFIAGIIERGHESVIEHWRALFEVEASDTELLDILLSSPLLAVSRRETRFLVSGNARMIRQAKGPLADRMRDEAREVTPVLFGGERIEAHPAAFLARAEGPVEFWSLFAPEGLSPEELFRHGAATFYLTGVSRTLTHQLVRHRMASYSQASQRYCNEENFGYVTPPSIQEAGPETYQEAVEHLRPAYLALKQSGVRGEDARYLLPGGTTSEIVVSMTMDAWANFFALRCDSHAQWEIREAAEGIRRLLIQALPALEKRL